MILCHFSPLVQNQLGKGETSSSGEGAAREGRGGRMEMGCEAKKKKKKWTGFHFTTTPTSDRHYLSVSHPFLSTTMHTHTHIMPPGSLTPKNCTRCHIKRFWPRLCSQMKNLRNSRKYLQSGSGLKWLRPGEVEVKPLLL